jgi:hypothetical protein
MFEPEASGNHPQLYGAQQHSQYASETVSSRSWNSSTVELPSSSPSTVARIHYTRMP